MAKVLVGGADGSKNVLVNALLDSGSEYTIIPINLAQKIDAALSPAGIKVLAVGNRKTEVSHYGEILVRASKYGVDLRATALVLPKLKMRLAERDVDVVALFGVEASELAHDGGRGHIQMIIGQDLLWHVLSFDFKAPLDIDKTLQPLVLHHTAFGWVLQGSVYDQEGDTRECNEIVNASTGRAFTAAAATVEGKTPTDNTIFNMLTGALIKDLHKFMDLESLGIDGTKQGEMKPLDKFALDFFKEHVRFIAEEGCYEVALIFKPDHKPFICNDMQAKNRFLALERRFQKYPEFKTPYVEYMKKYFDSGDCEPVLQDHGPPKFFLPHSAVFNPESPTTKCRVVMDASAKTPSGVSLNDCLCKGPNMVKNLLALLIRFRYHRIVLVADITRMYLCVKVREEDRNYLCFYWRENDADPLKVYRMKKVSFGVADSAFNADSCVVLHAEKYKSVYPEAFRAMVEDRYVDDVPTGGDTVAGVIRLKEDMIEMMSKGGFKFRKWMSSSAEVMATIPIEERADLDKPIDFSLDGDVGQTLKALGQQWNPKTDAFRFESALGNDTAVATRRNISSAVARLFDPLGVAQPFIITAKIIHQEAWKGVSMPTNSTKGQRKLLWDEPLGAEVQEEWSRWHDQLPELAQFTMPRMIRPWEEIVEETLHVFGDASPKAYAATVYLLSRTASGRLHSNFIISKSRVAPKRKETLARLELTASLIGCRLLKTVREALDKPDMKAVLWSDSMITCMWLRKPSDSWKEFIANRVKEIHSLSHEVEFRFIPGKQNPADLATRGITAAEFIESKAWLHGPDWLVEDRAKWPEEPFATTDEEQEALNEAKLTFSTEPWLHQFEEYPGEKAKGAEGVHREALANWLVADLEAEPTIVAAAKKEAHGAEEDPIAYLKKRFSDWGLLLRVTAYLLRLSRGRLAIEHQSQEVDPKLVQPSELVMARNFWVGQMQKECFQSTLNALKKKKSLDKRNKLKGLLPFVDDEGLLRVGGRLQHSDLPEEARHPLIIPRKHKLTELLIRNVHEEAYHAGPDWTLYHVRQMYWLLLGRKTVLSALKSCILCKRWRASLAQQAMAPLPAVRTREALPFEKIGLDFAGPCYVIRDQNKQDDQETKNWIALFVCMVTRAVHVEVVSDVTAEAFLRAFRRFCARRGIPVELWSDNARTFEKANKELMELWTMQEMNKVFKMVSDQGCSWRFNTPSAPWQGGVFERLVKLIKDPLKKIISTTVVTHDELVTWVTEIEGIVNGRPLSSVTENCEDTLPISPNMLLWGHELRHFPNKVAKRTRPEPQRSTPEMRWRKRLALRASFAQAFRKDYLMELQNTSKWLEEHENIQVGEVVLIDNLEKDKSTWPLARVVEVIQGRDGLVRNVVLKTAKGIIRRPVQRLAPLEVAPKDPVMLDFHDSPPPEDVQDWNEWVEEAEREAAEAAVEHSEED